MKKKIICPLCKSSQFQKISDNVRYNTGQKVFKCIKCEIIFNTPFVDTNFYKSDFRKMYETIPSPKYIYNNSIDEANNRFNRFKNLIKNQSTILEIGCSCGNFLELFQQKNTKVIGIEPSIENRKFLRKIGISAFPDIADIKDSIKFDLIFMFHVLEHIEEPIEYLYNLKKYMHKNSKLIIEVPNVDDILIKFYKINEFFNFY
ncbi:class I SAM-dependent methyltransferase, partial [Candidatus Gracilibacteria bacterium]|nr:class I SAM-dependent methyltransferase [Candidatus Gracilibacteria bacterium]